MVNDHPKRFLAEKPSVVWCTYPQTGYDSQLLSRTFDLIPATVQSLSNPTEEGLDEIKFIVKLNVEVISGMRSRES